VFRLPNAPADRYSFRESTFYFTGNSHEDRTRTCKFGRGRGVRPDPSGGVRMQLLRLTWPWRHPGQLTRPCCLVHPGLHGCTAIHRVGPHGCRPLGRWSTPAGGWWSRRCGFPPQAVRDRLTQAPETPAGAPAGVSHVRVTPGTPFWDCRGSAANRFLFVCNVTQRRNSVRFAARLPQIWPSRPIDVALGIPDLRTVFEARIVPHRARRHAHWSHAVGPRYDVGCLPR
jgi:hypothetical protein